jgi:hypothetical protein
MSFVTKRRFVTNLGGFTVKNQIPIGTSEPPFEKGGRGDLASPVVGQLGLMDVERKILCGAQNGKQ